MKPDSQNYTPRSQKLNPAGVAAIPVATSSTLPPPPPPPSGAGRSGRRDCPADED